MSTLPIQDRKLSPRRSPTRAGRRTLTNSVWSSEPLTQDKTTLRAPRNGRKPAEASRSNQKGFHLKLSILNSKRGNRGLERAL